MRLLRGRDEDPEADTAITDRMVEAVAASGERALRVWTPPRHCSFGRRDVRAPGYNRARERALEHRFPPIERRTGGRAVAYTGSTVALALAEPIDDIRDGLEQRYEAVVTAVQRALWRLGAPAQRGEPERSFCPGGPSLQCDGKLAGFAQRVQRRVALVGGIAIVDGRNEIVRTLAPVYDALGLSFDPESVGSVDRAGGTSDPERVARTIEECLLDDRNASVERVDQED